MLKKTTTPTNGLVKTKKPRTTKRSLHEEFWAERPPIIEKKFTDAFLTSVLNNTLKTRFWWYRGMLLGLYEPGLFNLIYRCLSKIEAALILDRATTLRIEAKTAFPVTVNGNTEFFEPISDDDNFDVYTRLKIKEATYFFIQEKRNNCATCGFTYDISSTARAGWVEGYCVHHQPGHEYLKWNAKSESNAISENFEEAAILETNGPSCIAGELRVKIFCKEDLDKIQKNHINTQYTIRTTTILSRLKSVNNEKILARLPLDWQEIMGIFAHEFPNFNEFIDHLCNHFYLSEKGDGRIQFPHALLVGEPGIGKTEILISLSEKLCIPVNNINMATGQTSSILSGTDSHWANAETGAIFDALAYGDIANQIFILDEIDKATSGGGYHPGVQSGLYQLLERRTSSFFSDDSFKQLPLDASHLNWVATANHTQGMDEAILSRFVTFSIKEPTRDESMMIANRIYKKLLGQSSWGSFMEPEISFEVVKGFANMVPRDMGRNIEQACGNAVRSDRNYLTPEDFSAINKYHTKMGFN